MKRSGIHLRIDELASCGIAVAFALVLLPTVATGLSFADFAIYSQERIEIARHTMDGGLVGSMGDVESDTSQVPGIYSGGDVTASGSPGSIDGGVVANGSVSIAINHSVAGSIQSSAVAGTGGGFEVVLPNNSTVSGVIHALGDVLVGSTHVIGSLETEGGVTTLPNAQLDGNVFGYGAVDLGNNAEVGGNVIYGTTYNEGTNVDVTGTVSQGTGSVSPQTFSGVALPGPTSFTTGSGVVASAGNGLDEPLAPGEYGTLTADEIYLTAGTYTFSEIHITDRAELILDLSQGAIEVFVSGDVSFLGSAQALEVSVSEDGITRHDFDNVDPNLASLVWFETHGTFVNGGQDGDRGDWFGSIYAPMEGIRVERFSVIGALYAGGFIEGDPSRAGIELPNTGGNSTHLFVGTAYVPEPGSGTLVMLGLAALGVRRRRPLAPKV